MRKLMISWEVFKSILCSNSWKYTSSL